MKNIWLLFLFAPLICLGDDSSFECPRTLDVKYSAPVVPGWQIVESAEPHILERVGVFSGHPSERAALVPDSTLTRKSESKDIWNLPRPINEASWLACFYSGTSLIIARPLEQALSRCEVRYKATRTGLRLSVIAVQCS